MLIKTDILPKTQCIGSFHTEIAGQFTYSSKKGPIYLFGFEDLTEAGLVISNLLTNETTTIALTDVVKAKTLSGQQITYQKFDGIDPSTVVMAIMTTGLYECYDLSLTNPVVLTGVNIAGTSTSFTSGDNNTYHPTDLVIKKEEGNFGK